MLEIHLRRNLARYEREGNTEKAEKIRARLAELEQEPEADPVDEYHTGGGWYQVGDEKVQGKDAARALLEEK